MASSPSAVTLFLSRRFSRVSSATTSFSALVSRRRSLTSSDVAARAVSPANRFFPASRKSFDHGNKGSGRSPRGGRARRYCPRRAGLPVQCGSYLPPRSGAGSRDGCSSRLMPCGSGVSLSATPQPAARHAFGRGTTARIKVAPRRSTRSGQRSSRAHRAR